MKEGEVIAEERLLWTIDSVLNRLSLKQCADILECDLDEAEVNYLRVQNEEKDSKQILRMIFERRIEGMR